MTDNIHLLIESAKRSDNAAQGVDREYYSYYREEAFRRRRMAREDVRMKNGESYESFREDNYG